MNTTGRRIGSAHAPLPLPNPWPTSRLAELLVETRNGLYKPEHYYGSGIRILKMFNIGRLDGTWNLDRVDLIELTPSETATYQLRCGDILVNRVNSRELVGKCALVDETTEGAVFESKNMRVRVDQGCLDSAYFAAWMNSASARRQVGERLKQIVGQATLNRGDLESLLVPLPSLPEQRRIATALRKQLDATAHMCAACEDAAELLCSLGDSMLGRAFETVSEFVRLADLADCPDAFADGPFGSNLKTDHYSDSGARVIRLGNIGRGEFLGEDEAYIPFGHFRTLERHHVRAGDVIVAALGDGVRPAGRACLVPDALGPALVKADCFRIRLPGTIIDSEYLVGYLNSPAALSAIAGAMRGATRPRVNLGILKDAVVPLAPLSEQKRIAREIRQQLTNVAHIRSHLALQAAMTACLPAALMRRAFSGGL